MQKIIKVRRRFKVLKKIVLLFLITIGGFMLIITSDNLGEQGNRVMRFIGIIVFVGGVLSSLYIVNRKSKE